MDLSTYSYSFSLENKISKLVWNVVRLFLFCSFASQLFKKWRVLVLKCFGAKIEWFSPIYASVKIGVHWNLKIGANSSLGSKVDCYNQGKISVGANTVISQKIYLCASIHDYLKKDFPLTLQSITIGNGVWIAADSFIGFGAGIGNNSVLAVRAIVIKNVEKNTIVGGIPAQLIKSRNFE